MINIKENIWKDLIVNKYNYYCLIALIKTILQHTNQ